MSETARLKALVQPVALGELVASRAGKTPARKKKAYWHGEVPWVTAKDLKTLRLSSSQETISTLAVHDGAPIAQPGDILILVRGMTLLKDVPIGIVETPMSFNQDIRCLSPRGSIFGDISSDYLAYVLLASRDRLAACVTQAGHGTGRLAIDQLLSMPVPVPPIQIQEWLVDRIKPIERAISLLGELIAAKRDFKRGLMQALLTGRRRFREFGAPSTVQGRPPEGWSRASLGEIATIRVSNVDKHYRPEHIPVRLCNYMDVWTRPYIRDDQEFMKSTASQREVELFQLRDGDLLLTKDSETREEIAEPSVVLSAGNDLVLGYHLALLRSDPALVDGRFLAAQLRVPRFRQHFIRSAQGATRFGLTIDSLQRAEVWLPTVEEQQRIADLDLMLYREIEILEGLLDRFQAEQRGLMQKLLTGELAVPVSSEPEPVHA